jgi:hypothetical protein
MGQLFRRRTLFLLGLQAHGLAGDRAQRHPVGGRGHGDRDRRDVPAAGPAQPRADRRRAGARHRSARGCGASASRSPTCRRWSRCSTAWAAARRRRSARWSCCAFPGPRRVACVHAGARGGRRADRRGVADRLDHRLGQARRAHGQALHLPGPAGVQRAGVRCRGDRRFAHRGDRAARSTCRRSSRSSSSRSRSAS